MLALSTTTLALSIAPALRPAVVPVARVASPTMVTALTKVKDSIIPANAKDTIQNLYGYQALAWGVSGLCAPAWTAGLIGVTLSAVETTHTWLTSWSLSRCRTKTCLRSVSPTPPVPAVTQV